ncbi:MAG: hypothetical protein IKH57_23720 [Clostridia bacterium]|nr:hypothetical protein [Clostridia bacterium]
MNGLAVGTTMKVKCLTDEFTFLTKGQIYKAVVGQLGVMGVVDNTGECYVYPPEDFEVISINENEER